MSHKIRIDLENGKYTYFYLDGHQQVFRNGEPWRDLVGDKFVLCMAIRIEEQENYIEKLEKELGLLVDPETLAKIKTLRGEEL